MEFTPEQEVMRTVISRCWEDEAFKQELLASPIKTIKKSTGKTVELPKGIKLVVVDQTNQGYAYFNIPAKPNLDNMELTDDQMELVSGGLSIIDVYIIGKRAGWW